MYRSTSFNVNSRNCEVRVGNLWKLRLDISSAPLRLSPSIEWNVGGSREGGSGNLSRISKISTTRTGPEGREEGAEMESAPARDCDESRAAGRRGDSGVPAASRPEPTQWINLFKGSWISRVDAPRLSRSLTPFAIARQFRPMIYRFPSALANSSPIPSIRHTSPCQLLFLMQKNEEIIFFFNQLYIFS